LHCRGCQKQHGRINKSQNIRCGVEGTEAIRLRELLADFRATRGCGSSSKGICSSLDMRALAPASAFGGCCYRRDALAESVDLGSAELHEGRCSAYSSQAISFLDSRRSSKGALLLLPPLTKVDSIRSCAFNSGNVFCRTCCSCTLDYKWRG
jgi:hypothetical protein